MLILILVSVLSYSDFAMTTCKQQPSPKAVLPWYLFRDYWNEPLASVEWTPGAPPDWCDPEWPLSWIRYSPTSQKAITEGRNRQWSTEEWEHYYQVLREKYKEMQASHRSMFCEVPYRVGFGNCIPDIYLAAEKATWVCAKFAKGPYRVKWSVEVRTGKTPEFRAIGVVRAWSKLTRPDAVPGIRKCLSTAAVRHFASRSLGECTAATWRRHSAKIRGHFVLHTAFCRYY